MNVGKMTERITIVKLIKEKDKSGFTETKDEQIASVRAYREGRHGSLKWSNLSSFSDATDLFRFRRIPNRDISTDCVIIHNNERFSIISVENVKGKNMYLEVLAKKVVSANG